MTFRFQILEEGLGDMIEAVEHIENPPSFRTIGALENVLRSAFVETQAFTHVITGSLKSTGRTSSSFDGHEWEGNISYGGLSGGPNNPVQYALYERNRGGEHDFYRNLPLYHDAYVEAVQSHLRGE